MALTSSQGSDWVVDVLGDVARFLFREDGVRALVSDTSKPKDRSWV